MSNTLLRDAIRQGLRTYGLAGASIALGVSAVPAAAQQATSSDQKGQSLETIVVTGSNIRRVDIETANPVVTVDRAAIEKSGKLTLGDLIQQLPSMAGAATNTNVNNGGGTGAATISLRGLGTQRSLLLINGHRVAAQLQDLNMLPAAAVERIEVLTEGASTVYGSDAVAGVVNIITRSNYQGAEIEADYGISDHDDGERKGYRFLFGQTTDKGNIIGGVNYNHQDAISAANRKYSANAVYLYQGAVTVVGSSRGPRGYIKIPSNLQPQFGCSTLARNDGATGTALSDYHCFSGSDTFNFQGVGNYDLTPSERTGGFLLGNYKLTDSVEVFVEAFHNKTTSRAQLAPLPLDAQVDGILISAQNYYNPFGVNFGQDANGVYNEFRARLSSLGDRALDFQTSHDLITTGFKGTFGDSSWSWNADFSFGHLSQELHQFGFLNYSHIEGAIGPSFLDPVTGKVVCGTPGNIIAGCTPINIFNLNDPNTISVLRSAQSNPFVHLLYMTKQEEASVSGSLVDLPAGPLSLAVGVTHRREYADANVDSTITGIINSKGSLVCELSNSICSNNTQGSYNLREGYAELLIPVLKEVPFVHSLNIDLGDRYSKYSDFGSTNNWKVAIEYRPIEDLLLRGTMSKVFRAPQITDIYRGAAGSAPPVIDPCNNLAPGQTNAACQYIVGPFKNTGTAQAPAVIVGSSFFGLPLKPEHGKSFDYGFVYDPHWVEGLSISADLYKITLQNLIVSGGNAQYTLDTCFQQNGGPFCSLISRIPSGSSQGNFLDIYEPAINVGSLMTRGADFGVHYRLPETRFGNFNATVQATYIDAYNVDNGIFVQGIAGHFDKTFGNFARWRGLATLDWNLGPWNAEWTGRYIGRTTIGYANGNLGPSGDLCGCYLPPATPILKYGAFVYHNVSLGYNIEAINTMVQIGIDNVADKQPPIYYLQNVINANTDVNTFDTIGRYYFAKVTVKF